MIGSWAPLTLMTFLFLILVILQVRWTGEISRIQQRDMRMRLEEKMESFARDFDREITRLAYTFRIPASEEAPHTLDDWREEIAARQNRWSHTSPYPELIDQIALIFPPPDAVYLFNQRSRKMERAEPTPDLEKIRRLAESKKQESVFFRPEVSADPPAIFYPGDSSEKPAWACLIVRLNQDVLAYRLAADLARKYFFRNGESEYHLAIVGTEADRPVLYRTDVGSKSAMDRSDGAVGLGRLRLEDMIFSAGVGIPEPPPPPPPAALAPGGLAERDSEDVYRDFVLYLKKLAPGGLKERVPETGSGPLRLLARHRSGSLNAAAASGRRRNLFISLGTLFLLAGALVTLYLSARQARRIARRQREFVAGISHELRTPLAVICAGAENLADGISTGDQEGIREYGAMIRDEGRRLDGLVKDLLEYSVTGSGRKRYLLRKMDAGRMMRETLERYRGIIREAGMRLDVDIPEGPRDIHGDPEALSRAVGNLIANAVRHGKDGGWLGLKLDASPDGREIRIEVADRGPGIPRKDQRRIFLPFERGEDAVGKQIRGAGIGLSLVKHIVERHQGRVTVASRPGRGARFTLHFPAAADFDDQETA